jgi:hypothetical protein
MAGFNKKSAAANRRGASWKPTEMELEARRQKETVFFELAERFRGTDDPKEIRELGHVLGRFIFGE